MKDKEQEILLSRILSSIIRCNIKGSVYYFHKPTWDILYESNEIYKEIIEDTSFLGILHDDDLCSILIDSGLWSFNSQNRLDVLPKEIESYKIEMYESYCKYQGKRVEQLRDKLKKLMDELKMLFSKRYILSNITCEGLANIGKNLYIIKNIVRPQVENNYMLLEHLLERYISLKISDEDVREISKLHTWRSIWSMSRNAYEIFGYSLILCTDEQRSLINWSRLYDNIYENSECPSSDVINDNDLIDGWMILQGKKQDDERRKRTGDGKSSGMKEVFIPVETIEDAKRVEAMNDANARMLKRQRMNLLSKKGVVEEQYMPDSQLELRMKAQQQIKEKVLQKRR